MTGENVARFIERLAQTVENEGDADVHLEDDSVAVIDMDGRVRRQHGGAEAVLILRGPEEGRELALSKLLASVK